MADAVSVAEAADGGNTHAPLTRVLGRSVRPGSLVFSIAHWLGSAIIEGTLPPGGSISSVEIAARFDTSRAPVRDALIILEREGLVTTSVGRASRVTHVALEEIRDIFEIRSSLHALVAQRIVRDAPDGALAELREVHTRLAALAAADAVDAYFWTNIEFRDAEARIAGNAHLRQLLDSLGLRTLLVRHVGLSQPGRPARSVIDHERLLEATKRAMRLGPWRSRARSCKPDSSSSKARVGADFRP